MVNTNDMVDPVKIAKEQALKLGNDKAKLEEELKEWLSILNKVIFHCTFTTCSLWYTRNIVDKITDFLFSILEWYRNG